MEEVINNEGKKNSFLRELLFYALIFLCTLLLFICLKPMIAVEGLRNGVIAQSVMAILLGVCVMVGVYLWLTKRLTVNRLVFLFLLAGYIIRVGYMLYTPAATRQQDTYTKNFDGHEAYAWTIFSTGKLPSNNVYQFYHPPLNALVQAGFMRIMSAFTAISGDYFPNAFLFAKPDYIGAERWFLYSSCQILCVLYSMMTAVVTLKIIKLFHFSDKTYLLLAAFAIFFPRNVQFSAMLNNDGLSFLFSMCALYYALKWWKGGKRFGWIILCALAVGLGMMTKFSSATVCLPIAGIFICEFFRTINKKENSLPFAKLFLQYAAFLCVCVPLGLWFQVYAKIRFDQGLGYVFDNLNRKLYTGDHSFFGRFFIAFDFSEYFGSIWCRPFEGNYNLFNYALRSAIFGEFTYWQGEGFAVLAIILAYLVSAILFISIIYCLVHTWKKKKEGPLWNRFKGQAVISFDDFLFLFLFMQSQALSEIYFYITMPYGCTMDFRYIMPIISAIALTIGFTQRGLEKVESKGAILLNRLLTMSTVGFLLVSMLFYCVCI